MADGSQFERVEDDDPNRCQAMVGNNQCHNKAIEGVAFCEAHNGYHSSAREAKERKRDHYKSRWQARIERHANAPEIKSLRSEIGILRMMMEEQLNRCSDESELLMQSQQISDLVSKIERTVTSCHKIESQMGQLLDKTAVVNFASEIIGIIADEHLSEDAMERISNRIIKAATSRTEESGGQEG